MIESDSEEEEEDEDDEEKVKKDAMQRSTSPPLIPHLPPSTSAKVTYNMDTDISLLEAPTFTTLDRGPSQPMVDLTWNHDVDLIGKKVSLYWANSRYLQ